MGNKQAKDGEIKEEIIISNNHQQNNAITYEQKQPLLENQKEDVEFKIFVGIDFGTDGCGLAYAVRNPNNQYENQLNINNINDNEMEHVKIHTNFKDAHDEWGKSRTSVLLDADDELQCVGGEAAATFVNMKNTKGWKLFERFKMHLYESPKWKSKIMSKKTNVNKVNLKDKIVPTNGGEAFPSKYIFIYELKQLRTLALEFLKMHSMQKRFIKFKWKESDIQWILTVPAIWSNFAKNKMQQWAQDAKLIDAKIRNQLKIVYEPDCASLSVHYACNKWDIISNDCLPIDYENKNEIIPKQSLIKYEDSDEEADIDYGNLINIGNKIVETVEIKEEIKHNNDENEMKYTAKDYTQYLEENIIKLDDKIDPNIRFNIGDIYCLVDCGGGTCDIACHKTSDKYATEEIFHPTGGHWGSMNIDKQFVKLLQLIFGKDIISEFKCANPGMWLQFNKNFCNDSKASFYNSNNSLKKYHQITIPANFSQFIHQKYDNEIDKINQLLQNKSFKLFQKNDMLAWKIGQWHSVTLQIHNRVYINYLFEPETVSPIINHLISVLNEYEMRDCKYIVLVGGLANSRYYQQRIYNRFGNKIQIIVPDKPQLCVVSGAARMGINPNYIQSRKLPQTYGIRIDYAKHSLPNIQEFDQHFLNENTYLCPNTKKDYVKNIFSIFVSNDTQVKFDNKPYVRSYFRRHYGQKTIDIKIFSSTKSKPLHVLENESNEIGEIKLLFNTTKNNKTNELEIFVEFYFNDTTLKVFAYPKNQENMKQEYRVNYLGSISNDIL